jgi:hypothetical protein
VQALQESDPEKKQLRLAKLSECDQVLRTGPGGDIKSMLKSKNRPFILTLLLGRNAPLHSGVSFEPWLAFQPKSPSCSELAAKLGLCARASSRRMILTRPHTCSTAPGNLQDQARISSLSLQMRPQHDDDRRAAHVWHVACCAGVLRAPFATPSRPSSCSAYKFALPPHPPLLDNSQFACCPSFLWLQGTQLCTTLGMSQNSAH